MRRGGEDGEKVGERMCEKMYEKICEKRREKIGEKIYESKRETAIYKVRSLRRTTENDVKHPEVRHKKMSLRVHILHKDGQIVITVWDEFWLAQVVKVQWEPIWDPGWERGPFRAPR